MTTSDFEPGPLADVGAESGGDGRWTLVFIRELHHPPEKVWGALVEPAQLRQTSGSATRSASTPGSSRTP